MSAQNSYTRLLPIAYVGLIYAQAPHDIVSRATENGPAAFGIAVSRGTDKDKQAVPGGTDFIGITARVLDKEGAINTGAIAYEDTETMAIIRDGYIWAVCPAGCTPGDAVKYNNTTGVLDSGAAGAGETQLDGAQWDSTAAAAGLAVIRLAGISTTAGS